MSYQNEYDVDGRCKQTGDLAEDLFLNVLVSKGLKVRKATKAEQYQHIDYIAVKDKTRITFDVKGIKKINRYSDVFDYENLWVEFKNVVGKDGWLYGKSDCIAVERKEDFLVIPRVQLKTLCEKLVDQKQKVYSSKEALYKIYTREGRKDKISMIKISDVLQLNPKIWQKIT